MNKIDAMCELYSVGTQYYDYILGSDTTFLLDVKKNLNILSILFMAFRYVFKSESIKKINEVQDGYLAPQDIDKMLSKIVKKTPDNKYLLGDIEFENQTEILKSIRDKMAHGAFLYDSNAEKILLNINDKNVEIDIYDFLDFSMGMISGYYFLKEESNYHRKQYYAANNKPIREKNEIDEFLKNQRIINFYFYKSSGKLNSDDKLRIEELLRIIEYNIKNGFIEPTEKNIRLFLEPNLKLLNIKYNIMFENMKNNKKYKSIKDYIIKNFNDFQNFPYYAQSSSVACYYEKIIECDLIKDGTHYNTLIIEELKKVSKNTTFMELMSKKHHATIQNGYIEILATTLLARFFALYHYPLENVCKIKDNIDGNEYFDYDKLDLSFIKPKIFKLPKRKLEDLENRINSNQNNINELDIKILEQREKLGKINKLIENEDNEQKIEGYKKGLTIETEKLDKMIEHRLETIQKLKENQQKYDELIGKTDNYYYNRYLIEYIRNAIAHGNVSINYEDGKGAFNDTTITFKNIFEGEVYLDLTISLLDFEKMFCRYNEKVIVDYINTKEDCILVI